MSISMRRRVGACLVAMTALPIGAADDRVCVGTYDWQPTIECRNSPGNLNYARFRYAGTVRIQGTFEVRGTGSQEELGIRGTISLDPGFPVSYAYRGEGLCVGEENRVSGTIEPDRISRRTGVINLPVGSKFTVVDPKRNGAKWYLLDGNGLFVACTLQ